MSRTSRNLGRTRRHRILSWGWLTLACCAFASSAGAVQVFFQGPSLSGAPSTNYGLGESQAFDLRDNQGFEILDEVGDGFSIVGTTPGRIEVTNQSLQSSNPNPPSGPSTATSSWTVSNVSGDSYLGASYMIFTHTNLFEVSGIEVDYLDDNVGLDIAPADGWSILRVAAGASGTFYYPILLIDRAPASPLDGVFAPGVFGDPLSVNYVLNEELMEAPAGSMNLQLPGLNIGFGFRPIPEPGTAALLTLGLVGLSLATRRSGRTDRAG